MLKDKRYFLFDIDGTLAVDETLYDGTKELLDYIREQGGHITLHDKSPAEEIYDTFGVSKKTFKKAVGDLYKKHLVSLQENGIELAKKL